MQRPWEEKEDRGGTGGGTTCTFTCSMLSTAWWLPPCSPSLDERVVARGAMVGDRSVHKCAVLERDKVGV
jgi:hypothetical protein